MSLTPEELELYKNEPAVLSVRTEANVPVAERLEDPNIFPDLVESGLLDTRDCLQIGQVLNAVTLTTLESLTPLTPENVSGYTEKTPIYLDENGLRKLWTQLKDKFQRTLTSGSGIKIENNLISTREATDTTTGTIKLNSSESITLNSDGQLTVGGRLGQTVDGGLYSPVTADPVQVKRFSLVLSEAKKLSVAHRDFIIAGGSNVTIKTAAAGTTEYRVSNSQNNRFVCACFKGGRLAIDEASAKDKTVAVTSVKFANGNDVVPYFGDTENDNDIIITVDETLNPDETLSTVRGYGTWANADIVSVGQGNGAGGGKTLQVGQSCLTNNNNQVLQVGNRSYTTANNCYLLGSDLLNKFQYVFLAGQGHDTTNGRAGVSAVGQWSNISANTLFAVGAGTSATARTNAFEVLSDGIVLKSPNGKRWKVTVNNSGSLVTSAL